MWFHLQKKTLKQEFIEETYHLPLSGVKMSPLLPHLAASKRSKSPHDEHPELPLGQLMPAMETPKPNRFWRNHTPKKNEFASCRHKLRWRKITKRNGSLMTLSDMSSSQRWATDFTRFPSLVYLLHAVLFSYNNLWFSFIIFIHQKDPTTKKHQRHASNFSPHLSAEWTFTQPQVAGKGLFFRAFSAVGWSRETSWWLLVLWCF